VINRGDGDVVASVLLGLAHGGNKITPVVLPFYYDFEDGATDEEIANEVGFYADPFVQTMTKTVMVLGDNGEVIRQFDIELGEIDGE